MKHLTIDDGLASNTIHHLYLDSKGYLWLCSDKGLMQYNGRQFRTFTTSEGLPDNEVLQTAEDCEGRLWIATFTGQLCYYQEGTIHNAVNTPWLRPYKFTMLLNFYPEQDGSLSILEDNCKKLINIKGDHITVIKLNYTLPIEKNTYPLIVARKLSPNRYAVATRPGYAEQDTLGNILLTKQIHIAANARLVRLNKQLCFFTDKGLIDPMSQQVIGPLSHKGPDYTTFLVVQDKQAWWVARRDGLQINDSIELFKGYVITGIARDRFGSYWVSTKDEGIFRFGNNPLSVLNYDHTYKGEVVAAAIKEGTLLFGTVSGDMHTFKNGQVKSVYKNSRGYDKVLEVSKGQILVLDDFHYFQFRPFPRCEITKGNAAAPGIVNLTPDSANFYTKELLYRKPYLYCVNVNSIDRFTFSKDKKMIGAKESLLEALQPMNRIYSRAISNSDGKLWISRADGMFAFDDKKMLRKKGFEDIIFKQFTFLGQYLIGYTDKNEFFVINNYGIKPVKDHIEPKNYIWDYIYPIDSTHAVISTNSYCQLLSIYPAAAGDQPRYALQALENPFIPRQVEYIAADTANCYFFYKGTITQLPTHMLFEKTKPPVPIFTTVKSRSHSSYSVESLTLTYKDAQNISISFDNLSFIGKDVTSQYSITGKEKDDWRDISGNEININNPGFGDLIIKIRSKSLSSGYSQPAVLRLHILKPFWATWWFIILCIIIFIVLIWAIVQLLAWRKIRRQQKQHEADMKYQQSEYKALNALMNPHFIFNSLNNIQGLINKDEKRTANEYLVIFSDLVRQNMHNISKGFISLQQELNLIENYLNLEKLRFRELINYEIKVDEAVETEDIMIPPLMIQPLVENAVKHGLLPRQSPDNKVTISVYEKGDKLCIEIEDNGVGLTSSQQSKNRLYESFGLTNLQKRTEHLKKIQKHEIDISITELFNGNGTSRGTLAMIKIDLD